MHKCKFALIRCMDFRIGQSRLQPLLDSIDCFEGDYDLISVAGAGKDLLSSNPEEAAFMFKQISISLEKHGIEEVVIVDHDTCGAYGIADAKQEDCTQVSDLSKAKALIAEKFPKLLVRAFILKGTPSGDFSLLPV